MYFLFFKVNEMINDDKKSPKEKEIINKDRCCYSTKWNNNKSDNDNGKKYSIHTMIMMIVMGILL